MSTPQDDPLAGSVRERAASAGSSGDQGLDPELGQVVLVLQGGGALGAYQAGVYEALAQAQITPDWVIGTSIGAINAALIAGNPPERRLDALREFWRRVRHQPAANLLAQLPFPGRAAADAAVMAGGVADFFEVNPWAALGPYAPLGPDRAAYYNTAPLERTLEDLVDFDLVNAGPTRLTVGAANVGTGEMRYFDSRHEALTARHVMASGALPPAFPAVRIDGELFWDGGVLSNTPVEAVFDDAPRRSGLVFAVHMWSPHGREPASLAEVTAREKDLRYASRANAHIARQKQIHRLRHLIAELAQALPEDRRDEARIKAMAAYGCLTRMHVVRLLAPALEGETSTKDIDFTEGGICARWSAGVEHTRRVLAQAPWRGEFDPLEGFILHEASDGRMVFDG